MGRLRPNVKANDTVMFKLHPVVVDFACTPSRRQRRHVTETQQRTDRGGAGGDRTPSSRCAGQVRNMREPRWRKQVEKREREPGAREEKARMRTRDRMHALLACVLRRLLRTFSAPPRPDDHGRRHRPSHPKLMTRRRNGTVLRAYCAHVRRPPRPLRITHALKS
jgi:hypothetical protein